MIYNGQNYKTVLFRFCCGLMMGLGFAPGFAPGFVQAENLVSTIIEPVVSLSASDRISHLLTIEDPLATHVIALGETGIWTWNDEGDNEGRQWRATGATSPQNVNGVINDGPQAFLLVGALANGTTTHVRKFSWPVGASVEDTTAIPPLPVALVFAQGAVMDDTLYVAGRDANGGPHLLSFNPLDEDARWVSHAAGPMMASRVTSVVAQNFSLLVTVAEEGGDRLLQWTPEDGWQEQTALFGTVVPGSARAMGQGHVLYIVKDTAGAYDRAELMSFHVITGAWASYGALDAAAAGFATTYKNGLIWGQAGGNGADFSAVEIEKGKHLLHVVDWLVIAVYLFGMLGVGLYFYIRSAQNSQSDFFLGGRSIPFWAAGISLYASNASSISYIAVPAKAFATNWQYLMSNLIVVVGLVFVAIWIVPLIRRLNLMSIFQYLETRFHPSIRVLSSALFIVFQLGGRMTVILFLPSLAIATVTGIDVASCILVMGGITIVYTVLGGMKAVIWTDVMQLFVMFGGTIFAIIFVMLMLDGGVGEFFSTAMADGKMKMVDWSFDLTEATVWGFIFLVLFDTVLTFPKDQVLMQRVLSTESAKDAGRSVWTFALIVIPGSVMFYVVGTALYVFYQSHPERMDPSLSIDATFPLFIAAELPFGITGLIIAGIFAASMSTLSSILNSVATVVTVDFYSKIAQHSGEKKTVRFAEIITVVAGVIGIGLALILSMVEIHSLLDLALELWGLLGGGFAGAYTLGMFTRRSNWQGVSIGVAVSIAVTLAAWVVNLVHPYFYLPLSVMVCIVVGYSASWLFPAPVALKGLTIFEKDTIT